MKILYGFPLEKDQTLHNLVQTLQSARINRDDRKILKTLRRIDFHMAFRTRNAKDKQKD